MPNPIASNHIFALKAFQPSEVGEGPVNNLGGEVTFINSTNNTHFHLGSLLADETAGRVTYPIDEHSYRSPNFGERRDNATVDTIVVHYTAASFKYSMNTFTNSKSGVSAHYLIPDTTDSTYRERGHDGMQIFNLVDEKYRAWHAGQGQWQQRGDVNSRSIGIEIVNLATDDHGTFKFPPFNTDQIRALRDLMRDILVRHPHIRLENVIAHSDMTSRKSDPGPQFPWESLGEGGLAAWYSRPQRAYLLERIEQGELPTDKPTMIRAMKKYGYSVSQDMSDKEYRAMVRAFQMHFCPEQCGYSGEMNKETAATLYAVCCQYCPDALEQIANCTAWDTLPETTTRVSSGAPHSGSIIGRAITSVESFFRPLWNGVKWVNRLGVENPPLIDWAREAKDPRS